MLKTSTAGKFRRANSDVKNQMASYAAKLHRINRFLDTLKICNQAVLEATRELLDQMIAEPASADQKSSKSGTIH